MIVSVTKRRFTVEEYYTMARSGILREDDRVELIAGEINQMTPIGSRHMACIMRFSSFLHRHLTPEEAVVSVQNPIRLDEFNEPEPDVALLKPRTDFYENQHPRAEDVLLIVEVSDTTLAYDRDVKVPLYAWFGIPEVWIADVEGKTVTVYRTPSPQGYEEMKTYRGDQTLFPSAFPEMNISVHDILG
ncbi:MAG TPA: Uma2 family endonuclease [bacterium]|nr:Uma2 family endonuclease [bacterium]HOL94045.1 Uma2 family endonuclease [bacterium]HPP02220.1 Uma2 family endonuclease [bacterium]HXK95480.1 Uma2 family endonuclease [bacterium]